MSLYNEMRNQRMPLQSLKYFIALTVNVIRVYLAIIYRNKNSLLINLIFEFIFILNIYNKLISLFVVYFYLCIIK